MTLLDRLIGTEDPKIPIHEFMAAMGEYKRGALTGTQVVSGFDLSVEEAVSLQSFLDNLDSSTIDRALIHDVLLLAEGERYTKAMVKTRLGV